MCAKIFLLFLIFLFSSCNKESRYPCNCGEITFLGIKENSDSLEYLVHLRNDDCYQFGVLKISEMEWIFLGGRIVSYDPLSVIPPNKLKSRGYIYCRDNLEVNIQKIK